MAAQVFGLISRIRVKICEEMKKILHIQPKLRPLDPERLARIPPGAMHGIWKLGYGSAVRKVRVHNRNVEVTLAWEVVRDMRIAEDSCIVVCRNEMTGKLTMAEDSTLDERDVDGRPILGEIIAVSRVRKSCGSYEMSLPIEVRNYFGDVTEKYIKFEPTKYPGVVTIQVVGQWAVTEGKEKMVLEGLRRWPVIGMEAVEAWLVGFEPFREAMANTILPKRYPCRDPRNLARVAAMNEVMIETADWQVELRRSIQWIK